LGDWLERGRFGEPDTFYLQQMVNRDNFPQSQEDWIVPGSLHNVRLGRVEAITVGRAGQKKISLLQKFEDASFSGLAERRKHRVTASGAVIEGAGSKKKDNS
jgi:hypothetical protein